MLHPLVEGLQLILEQFERDLIGMTKKDALTMLKEKIDEFFKVIELTETEEKCICNHYGVFHPTEGCPIHDDRKKPETEDVYLSAEKARKTLKGVNFLSDNTLGFNTSKPKVKLEKWTEKYLIVCPSCGGLGAINNPQSVTSTAQITCPACLGSKTVYVIKEQQNLGT